MTSNVSWDRVPVSSVALGIFDGPHATPKPAAEGPVFLGIQNITEDGRIDLSNIRHISEEDYHRWTRRACPEPGDIVFTYEATLNRYAIIPEGFVGCLGRRVALIRPNPKLVHPRYLLAYFMGDEWREVIARNVLLGSTVDRIPLTSFPEFEIALPPMSVQRTIASILSAYDDLIENNLRRIAILEEIAQAIYREWFVEFRYPGHEDSVLVKSECGLIPDGWEAMRLTDAVQVNPAVKVEKKLEKPYADMACLSTSSMIVQFKETRTGASGSKFKNGDTLVARITPCLENGKTGFVQGLRENEVALGSTEFIVLRSVLLCPEYVYLMARTDSFRQHAVKSMTGASGRQRVQIACFNDYLLAIPPRGLLDQFSMIAVPMFRQAWTLSEINDKLRQIRDLLLPRLISGELDVSDIAISTEEDNL